MKLKRLGIAMGILLALGFLIFVAMVRFGGIVIREKETRRVIFGYDQYNDAFLIDEYQQYPLAGSDGPYLSNTANDITSIAVIYSQQKFTIESTTVPYDTTFECRVDNEDRDRFQFSLSGSVHTPSSFYDAPEKIIALSDIEGNFNALYSLLISNGVMDSSYRWTFGRNHLVIGGDVMDRGNNVTEVLWLIYHLERQAHLSEGRVHFLLGNHELMNLEGNVSYVNDKYFALAQRLSGVKDNGFAYRDLMRRNNVMIDWMKQKNCIVRIGRTLFLHGGISPEMLEKQLTIEGINSILRHKMEDIQYDTALAELVTGNKGPLWYRGLAIDFSDHAKVEETFVDSVLKFYDVDRIAIGHTIVNQVSIDYNGKVIRTDVVHGTEKYSPDSQAVLIEGSSLFRINGRGEKTPL